MMVRQTCCAIRVAVARSGARRVWHKAALGVTFVGVVVVAMASSAFAAEGPVWKIVSVSSPTVLAPNTPRNEAQSVAVNATGGIFALTVATSECSAGGEPQTTAPIPYEASAVEVQSALEALSCDVGEGNVTVAGGPGGSSPYLVTFVGSLGDRPVHLMKVDSSSLMGGAATVSEATHGELAPHLLVEATNVGSSATDGSTIMITDSLPPALTATAVTGVDAYASGIFSELFSPAPMSCSEQPTLSCSYSGGVDPGDTLVIQIPLKTAAESLAPEEVNGVTVTGGGAADTSASDPITIGDTPVPFGPAPASVVAATSTSQAGGHGNVTAAFTMATRDRTLERRT